MNVRRPVIFCLAILSLAAIAAGQSTQPTLESLDREVQRLYRDTQTHIVRVQVPVRILLDHPMIKWRSQLDPRLREQLDNARRVFVQPQSDGATPVQTSPQGDRIALPPMSAVINVEFVGIVLNERGEVLLPVFIDQAYLQAPLQVTLDEKQVTTATLAAADRQTSLTIIRLAQPAGKPARFAGQRPLPGSMILMISPTRRAARLAVWAGGQDDNAILVNRDGEFAGILRNGNALFPATLVPIVEQLLTSGAVQRAQLGVRIREVPFDDPQRIRLPALGAQAAARVEEVIPDSAAATGGIQIGDLITSLAGEAVGDVPTFAAALANRRGRTELIVLRDGQERRIIVDLQPQ